MICLTPQQRQRLADAGKNHNTQALDEVIELLKKESPKAFRPEALEDDRTEVQKNRPATTDTFGEKV